jgi:hypothetical protein
MQPRTLTGAARLRLAAVEQRLAENDSRLEALEAALLGRHGAASEPAGATAKAGWSIPAWCEGADLSKSTYYDLPPDVAPQKVRIGARTVIVEAPKDWLERRLREQEREAEGSADAPAAS